MINFDPFSVLAHFHVFDEKNKFKKIENGASEIADSRWRTIICMFCFNDIFDNVNNNESVVSGHIFEKLMRGGFGL